MGWGIVLIFKLLVLLLLLGVEVGGWQFYATDTQAYEAGRDAAVRRSGHSSAHIQSLQRAIPLGFALFWQKVDASRYRGSRVRLRGYLRTSGVSGRAALWMRVDPKDGPTLGFDNMEKRPIAGSTEWTQYSIELDVPAEAEEIHFGPLLVGRGEVWFDDLELTRVGPFVPGAREARRARHLPWEAQNLGFE